MLPTTIESGHGCQFQHTPYQGGYLGNSEGITDEYEGRVTRADSDQWERPDWTYEFVEDLRKNYGDKYKIHTQQSDKGWLHIYFRPITSLYTS